MRHLVLLIGVAFAAGCQTNRPMTSSAPHFRVESTIEPGSEAIPRPHFYFTHGEMPPGPEILIL